MIFNLPNKLKTKRRIKLFLIKIQFTRKKALWAFTTNILALICLLLALALNAPSSLRHTITPLVASVTSFAQTNSQKPQDPVDSFHNFFSFAPGSVPNKFSAIDLNGLTFLSFFDVPVNTDGTLNTDSDGYQIFQSDDADTLFQRAHQNGTKVLLTLTSSNNDDINSLLFNTDAQQNLYQQTAQEISTAGIDGVTIDFEYNGQASSDNRTKFTNFVKSFSNYLHQNIRDVTVGVAVADNAAPDSLYAVKELAAETDKVQIMAYSFAVPETLNAKIISPVFGYDSNDYLKGLGTTENNFLSDIPKDKIVMERAWYGNGNNYPLYNSDSANVTEADTGSVGNTLNTPLSADVINRLVADVPDNAKDAARANLPYIADALKKENILNANVLAYALATIQHETASTFQPIDEFTGRKNARRLGYEGGTDYYGRGFIQLTHLRNYQKMGRRIGMGDELVMHPELASRPDVAGKILAAYFKDFGIAKLASEGNFYDARSLINPDYNAESIAEMALSFVYALA